MPDLSELVPAHHPLLRILVVLLVSTVAHVLVRLVTRVAKRVRTTGMTAYQSKVITVTSLVNSGLVLAIWFGAFGLILTEAGLDLKTYFASATIIGLAVAFGSQGLVQDVVTGLTLVFSDLIDVGDMVEISGQTGVVSAVGVRFVELTNFMGAKVFVPNRSVTNVVSYPKGYVRALVDVRLSQDPKLAEAAAAKATTVVMAIYEQFPGICMAPPEVEGRFHTKVETTFLRLKLRIWPGQTAPLDALKAELIDTLLALDPTFKAWMVTITVETEEKARGMRPNRAP